MISANSFKALWIILQQQQRKLLKKKRVEQVKVNFLWHRVQVSGMSEAKQVSLIIICPNDIWYKSEC